ncbi:hypothetical protein [Peribacillus sp. NJ4]|uniref:hypothetical protein n=1 Tax=Peribacillus sp. NJ4 TaxID=3055862 RepID=UPI0025A281D4|nr:hypothetical protein [Peribacillus sp. NJ4]
MEATIDYSFIYDLVKDMYSEVGRPSIDPVIILYTAKIPIKNQKGFGMRPFQNLFFD